MKKTYIFIIIILIILFTGCFGNNDNSQKQNDVSRDLKLTIEMKNKTFNITNNSIIVSIELENIGKDDIEIPTYFELTSNIFLDITIPDGSKLKYSDLFASPLENYMLLKPNENIKKSFDIKNIIWKSDNEIFNWTLIGKYNIQAEYGGVYPHIFSNRIEFEIV